jgi:hypothetical protein
VTGSKEHVEDAPNIELEGDELSSADESVLYHHYELDYRRPRPADVASRGADARRGWIAGSPARDESPDSRNLAMRSRTGWRAIWSLR